MPAQPNARVVDTGFDPGESELKAYLMTHKSEWKGIRGVKALPKGTEVREPGLLAWDRKWHPGIGRWLISTALAQQRVHQAYLRRHDAPGGAFIPRNLGRADAYIRHLCAWQWKDGRWKQESKRDDHFDCRCYATSQLLWSAQKREYASRRYGNIGTL